MTLQMLFKIEYGRGQRGPAGRVRGPDVALVPNVRETWAAWEYHPPVHGARLQKYEDSDGSLKQGGSQLGLPRGKKKSGFENRDPEPTRSFSPDCPYLHYHSGLTPFSERSKH